MTVIDDLFNWLDANLNPASPGSAVKKVASVKPGTAAQLGQPPRAGLISPVGASRAPSGGVLVPPYNSPGRTVSMTSPLGPVPWGEKESAITEPEGIGASDAHSHVMTKRTSDSLPVAPLQGTSAWQGDAGEGYAHQSMETAYAKLGQGENIPQVKRGKTTYPHPVIDE